MIINSVATNIRTFLLALLCLLLGASRGTAQTVIGPWVPIFKGIDFARATRAASSSSPVAWGGNPSPAAKLDSADRETLIRDLVNGEYSNPVRIVVFNSVEGWCRDVTVDIADELRRRYGEFGEMPESVLEFMEANRR